MVKDLILLVGPQGSGKSTLYKNEYSDYFLISQDEQGKNNHFQLFLEALDAGVEKILVDRINHTKLQRSKYLEKAKRFNYKTKIIVLNQPYETCIQRMSLRKTHPTLNNYKKQEKALQLYFREYEIPLDHEADEIERRTDFDPYLLDLTNSNYEKFVVIGDIHGCYDELDLLLKKINYGINDTKTALIFVGDLIDKGPKPKKVFDFVYENENAYFVMGNHEYKLLRYLRGNNVSINHGLDITIDDFNLYDINKEHSKKLRFILESVPFIIKLPGDNYVLHAGINPFKNILSQRKELLLYIRTFNPVTGKISNNSDPAWFEEYSPKNPNIFFGHNYHEDTQVRNNVFSLDGYCVYGGTLRSCILSDFDNIGNFKKELVEVNAEDTYYVSQYSFDNESPLNHFDKLVNKGYLKKDEDDKLILYNYTDKTTFEKNWNFLTKQARGVIFEKSSGRVVARPLEKFFNLGEVENTLKHNLPKHLDYKIFEKLDGSLGTLYYYNNSWHISTRGRLNSDQSFKAEDILKKYNISKLNKKYTYMIEIIYPENKIIVDYGNIEDLYLLSIIDTLTSKEIYYDYLKEVAFEVGFKLPKEYNLKLNDLLENNVDINEEIEGFVIRFENNFRVKYKLKDYLQKAKLKSHFSEKILFKAMKHGEIDNKYFRHIPEEFQDEANIFYQKLKEEYKKQEIEIGEEFSNYSNLSLKELGLLIKEKGNKLKHSQIYFALVKEEKEKIDEYIMNNIKKIFFE